MSGILRILAGIRLRGSLTVEASFIMPIMIFVLMAFLHIIFFCHDRALMQSYAYRSAESILFSTYRWDGSGNGDDVGKKLADEARGELGEMMIMAGCRSLKAEGEGLSLKGLYHSLKSIQSIKLTARGSMGVHVPGVQAYLGSSLGIGTQRNSLILDYPDDWFKCQLRKKRR